MLHLQKEQLGENARFTVSSSEYNPSVWTGSKVVPLAQAIGLDHFGFTTLSGLAIIAHNTAGLLAACEWVTSFEGSGVIAKGSFSTFIDSATLPDHTIPERSADNSWEGKTVRLKGTESFHWLVVKHADNSLKLQSTGEKKQTLWRTLDDVQL
jgi:hypothetical protein